MGHRRCFTRFWTPRRRKGAAFKAGEMASLGAVSRRIRTMSLLVERRRATRFRRPLALVRPVALWPSARGHLSNGDRGASRALIELPWMALSAEKASLEATVLSVHSLSLHVAAGSRRCRCSTQKLIRKIFRGENSEYMTREISSRYV